MRRFPALVGSALFFILACGTVQAGHVMVDTTIGGLKIELHVLPAEPFFTKDQVSSGKVAEGMLIMGGARPVAPEAETHPNHHLVVHVFDAKTSKAVTGAKVKMSFQMLNEKGMASGTALEVPIVVMQAIGKGEGSTHYGNNVVMPDGRYAVLVVVNGKKMTFNVKVAAGADDSMDGMHMH